MARLVVAAALLMLGLAGCSAGEDLAIETPTASATPSSAAPIVAPVPVLTDTLHLLDAPHLAATLNPQSSAFRAPIPSAADSFGGLLGVNPTLKWSLPRPNMTALAGSAVVWVEVQGTVVHQDATNPCFWLLTLRLDSDDGGIYQQSGGCVEEPTVVPEGIRPVQFTFEGVDFSGFEAETLSFQLSTTAAPLAPGASVTALTGTLEYDGLLTIAGLQVPLDTQTLLV